MKIGMLTSGGDCPGLNAVMRAFAKYVCSHIEDVKIFGFLNGYTGLIENEYEILAEKDFEPLLLAGGTVLGSKRQPFTIIGYCPPCRFLLPVPLLCARPFPVGQRQGASGLPCQGQNLRRR